MAFPIDFTPHLTGTTQAHTLLRDIFGIGGPTQVVILQTIFAIFSYFCIFAAIFILLYRLLVGTIRGAQEGSSMRKWSSGWLPMRTAFGLALLVPAIGATPGIGYTLLQYLLFMLISCGVSMADSVWQGVVSFTDALGPAGRISLSAADVNANLGTLLQGLICEQSSRARYVPGDPNIGRGAQKANCKIGSPDACIYDAYPQVCTEKCTDGVNKGYLCHDETSSGKYKESNFCRNPHFAYGFDYSKAVENRSYSWNADFQVPYQSTTQYKLGRAGECGELQHCNYTQVCLNGDPNSLACRACAIQYFVLTGYQSPVFNQIQADIGGSALAPFIDPTIANVPAVLNFATGLPAFAQAYADVDYEYLQYYYDTIKYADDLLKWKEEQARPLPLAGSLTPGSSTIPPVPPRPSPVTPPPWIQDYCNKSAISPIDCDMSNLPAPGASTSGVDEKLIFNIYLPEILRRVTGSSSTAQDILQNFSRKYVSLLSKLMLYDITIKMQQEQALGTRAPWIADTINNGWMSAGFVYLNLSKSSAGQMNNIWPLFKVENQDPKVQTPQLPIHDYVNNYKAGHAFTKVGNYFGTESSGSAGNISAFQGGAEVSGIFHSLIESVIDAIQDNVKGDPNDPSYEPPKPLVGLARLGHTLLVISETVYLASFIATMAIGLLGGVNSWGFGSGGFNSFGTAMLIIYILTAPMLYLALGVFLLLGATLGIYIPLIPFVIFLAGILTWLISVIEAMVAAPIIAMGMLFGDNSGHEILGKASAAFFMVLSIILKPTLMIMGLFFGLQLSGYVVGIVNRGYWGPLYSFLGANDPLTTIIFIGIYVGIIAVIINKCFGLIHLLPDRILTWIGAKAGSTEREHAELREGIESAGDIATRTGEVMTQARDEAYNLAKGLGEEARKKFFSGSQADIKGADGDEKPKESKDSEKSLEEAKKNKEEKTKEAETARKDATNARNDADEARRKADAPDASHHDKLDANYKEKIAVEKENAANKAEADAKTANTNLNNAEKQSKETEDKVSQTPAVEEKSEDAASKSEAPIAEKSQDAANESEQSVGEDSADASMPDTALEKPIEPQKSSGNPTPQVGTTQAAEAQKTSRPLGAIEKAGKGLDDSVSNVAKSISNAADSFADGVKNKISALTKPMIDKANEVGDAIGDAASATAKKFEPLTKAVSDAAKATASTVDKAFTATGNAIIDAANSVKAAGNAAVNWVGDITSKTGNAVSQGAAKVSNAVSDAMTVAGQKVDAMTKPILDTAQEVGRKVSVAASDVSHLIQESAKAGTNEINKMGLAAKTFVTDTANKTAEEITKAKDAAVSAIKTVVEPINQAAQSVSGAIQSQAESIKTMITEAARIAANDISSAANGVKGVINQVAQTSAEGITGAAKEVKNLATKTATATAEGLSQVANASSEAIKQMTTPLVKTVSDVNRAVSQAASQAATKVGGEINKLTQPIVETTAEWSKAIQQTAMATGKNIQQGVNSATESIGQAVSKVSTEVNQAASKVAKEVSSAAGKANDAITDATSAAIKEINQVTREALQQIEAKAKPLTDAATRISTKVEETLKPVTDRAQAGLSAMQKTASEAAQVVFKQPPPPSDLPREKGEFFQETGHKVDQVLDAIRYAPAHMINGLSKMKEEIKNLPQTLQDAIQKAKEQQEKLAAKEAKRRHEIESPVQGSKTPAGPETGKNSFDNYQRKLAAYEKAEREYRETPEGRLEVEREAEAGKKKHKSYLEQYLEQLLEEYKKKNK